MIQPRNDRVLIERLAESQGLIIRPDIAESKGIEGIIRAVGPGKWIPGEWWCVKGKWEWFDGYRAPLVVRVGQRVMFNSKWNDFASDFSNDLPLGADKRLHLIQEADIFGVLP